METLVTLSELTGRTPFTMDENDLKEAQGALNDLSDDARHYGSASWATPLTTPRQVQNLILRAAVRHMKNYEGLTQSRAGDETVGLVDRGHEAGSAYFTAQEQRILRASAGGSTLHTVNVVAWGSATRDTTGYVPVVDGDKPFPYYASSVGPY